MGSGAAAWALLAACQADAVPLAGPPSATPGPTSPSRTPTPIPSTSTSTPPGDVSLEVKIGQMLLVGFRGLSIDAAHPDASYQRIRRLKERWTANR